MAVLAVVIAVVIQKPSSSGKSVANAIITNESQAVANPIDALSSADIALSVAQATNLPEAVNVANFADSMNAQLTVMPSDNILVAQPQIIATGLKSRADISTYVVQEGDSVTSIAAKFGITTDSVKWTNNLSSDVVRVGTQLIIPPVNGIVYTVKAGDTIDNLVSRYRVNREQFIAFNDLESGTLPVGERIMLPDGQQPIEATRGRSGRSSVAGFPWGGGAVYGYNGYDYGWCTWYAASRRAQLGRPVPSNLGDAWTWDDLAVRAGLTVNRTPAPGAVAVTSSNRRPGHVAIVEQVNSDGSIWISEMNSRGQVSMTDTSPAGGWGRVDYKLIPAGTAAGINYIH